MDIAQAPASIEAEMALLGTCLVDSQSIAECAEIVGQGDFFLLKHQMIWRAVIDLHRVSAMVDVLTVTDWLTRNNAIEAIGGVSYLTALMNNLYSYDAAPFYAAIIRRASLRRSLMKVSDEIKALAMDESGTDIETVLSQAQSKIADLQLTGGRQALVSIKDAADTEFKRLEAILAGETPPSVPTSMKTVKGLIKGYRRGEFVVVSARMGVGKTTYMQTEALYQANNGFNVVYACLEQDPAEITRGLICIWGGLPYDVVTEGVGMTAQQIDAYTKAYGEICQLPFWFADQERLTPSTLRAKVKTAIARYKADIVYVDYIGLMDSDGGGKEQNRAQELSKITRELKQLARISGIPIVAAAQLNRDAAAGRPTLKDIKDSDGAAADGDVVIALWRDVDTPTPRVGMIETNIDVLKQRNGALGWGKIGMRVPQKHFGDIETEKRTDVQNHRGSRQS